MSVADDIWEEVQRRKAALDALEESKGKSTEWISVEDRLPEINDEGFSEHVLVTIVGGTMFVAWRDNTTVDGWESDNNLPETPTHWMPLPKPPTDKE